MTGSIVFEGAPFAFLVQSIGTPDLPVKLHVNNKRKVEIPVLHRAEYVSYEIEKYVV
jgi:hypothetical protein